MTISSGFFNSHNHDRLYDAKQISSIFDGVILDGVYESIGDAFKVSPYSDSNDTILVGTGRAWFDHTWTLNDTTFSVVLSPPNALLKRIDTVVIDVNLEDDVRANGIKVVEGSYSEDPVAPKLIKEELHKQYPIADIRIREGESRVISAADITYRVGTSDCPLVTGPLTALNLDNYLDQWTANFNEWFEGIKDILDEHVAQDLQNQIDELRNKQGVNEKGEIGDYVIPFTKEVMQAIIDGGEGIHAESLAIKKFSSTNSKQFPSNYTYSVVPYNQGFILPNGSVCSLAFGQSDNGIGVSAPRCSLGVKIVTPEGVETVKYTEKDYYQFTENGGDTHRFSYNPYITNLKNDSYPVTFNFSIPFIAFDNEYMEYRAYNLASAVYYATVTIDSSGVVTINDNVSAKKHSNDYHIWCHENVCQMPAVLPDESVVYCNVFDGGNTTYVAFAHKLDSYGVLTSSNAVGISNISLNLNTTFDSWYTYGFYRSDDEKAVFRFVYTNNALSQDDGRFQYMKDNCFIVDPETLSITGSSSAVSIPKNQPFTGVGDVFSLSSGNIIKYSYNKNDTPTQITDGTFNPIILYDPSASTPVTSAIIFANYEVGSTTIAVLVNTGSNSRAVFVGKNNIGAYASKFSGTIANASKLNVKRIVRNPYRIRTNGNYKYWLFDTAGTYSNFTSLAAGGYDIGTGIARKETDVYLLKIWYDSEE